MENGPGAEKFTIANVGDLAADATVGIELTTQRGRRLLVVSRLGDDVSVFVNSCPHTGARLDPVPGYFLDDTGSHLLCQSHGALFDRASGACIDGPCVGASLLAVPHAIENGELVVTIAPDLPPGAGAAAVWLPTPRSD